MRIFIVLIVGLLAAGGGAGAVRGQGSVNLPDLGSSAEAIASPQEMRRFGRQMLGSFRQAGLLFDDPLLDEYIETLGFRLVAHANRPDHHFRFFLIRDRNVNAFAAPGGYIGTYAGLVMMTESEDELAAVIAHEIAHITQHHALRGYESASKASIPIMIGMLAALVAASQAGGAQAGEAAQAAVVSGMGLMQQLQINYTRSNEYEADRIGIQTLAQAGFDPLGMADVFGRMGRQARNYGLSPPEILRTHPFESTRIAEAKARAEEAARRSERITPPDPAGQRSLDNRFELFRERMRVLLAPAGDNQLARYREQVARAPDDPFQRYGLALVLARQEAWREAEELAQALLQAHPDTLAFSLLLADIEGRTGREAEALARYQALDGRHPDRAAVLAPYAELLLRKGDAGQARIAARLLRPLIDRDTDHAQLYALVGRAYELAGEPIRAAEAHALSAAYNGRFEDSMVQFERLQRRDDLDYYQRARVEARITELTPIVLEVRRRGDRGTG